MEDKINDILIQVFNLNEDQVKEDLGMDDVNNWDSLTHMNLIVAIEDEFSIELSGDHIADMVSFDQIRQTVSKYQ